MGILAKAFTLLGLLGLITVNKAIADPPGAPGYGGSSTSNNSVADRDRQGSGNVGGSTSSGSQSNNSVADRDRQGSGNVGGSSNSGSQSNNNGNDRDRQGSGNVGGSSNSGSQSNNNGNDRDRQGPGNVGGSTNNGSQSNNSVADRDRQGAGNVGGSTNNGSQSNNSVADRDRQGAGNVGSTNSSTSGNQNYSNGDKDPTNSGWVNTGDNPGNSTAPGYGNGGVSSYGTSQTHKEAQLAGYNSQVNAIGGTIGLGTTGASQAMQRSYYSGVNNYYSDRAIPPEQQTVPTGPMAHAHGSAVAARIPELAETDRLFREGSIAVADPRAGATREQIRDIVGPEVYDRLTDYQKFGINNSAVVSGMLTETIIGPQYSGFYSPVIDTVFLDVTKPSDIESVTRHEAVHAADQETYDRAVNTINDPKATKSQLDAAHKAIDLLESIVSGGRYAALDKIKNISTAYTDDTPKATRAANYQRYLSESAELHAYSADPNNKATWASSLSRTAGISVPEALDLLDTATRYSGFSEIEGFAATQPDFKR